MHTLFHIELKNQWPGFGISDEKLASMAIQIGCDHANFPNAATLHFRSAEKLLIFTCYEFFLLPYVFLQTVIGLERVLLDYYKTEQRKLSLKAMLAMAASAGLIPDEVYSDIPSDIKLDGITVRLSKPNEKLTKIIPTLRNNIVHGDYILTAEFLPLALKVRTLAEAIAKLGRESNPPDSASGRKDS